VKHIRKRLTYANVMSTIAVFLVLGGGAAFAAGKLGKNSVGTKQLKSNSVTTAKIKNEAVTEAKLAGNAVSAAKLADGAVVSGKVANGAISTGAIADKAVTETKLADKAVTEAKLADKAVGAGKLAENAVTSSKIGNGAVIASKLGTINVRENTESVAAGSQKLVGSGCNSGEVLLSIGYLWETNTPGLYIEKMFRFLGGAFVEATNTTGATHEVTVQAACLAAS
jgi:hypothetical protein